MATDDLFGPVGKVCIACRERKPASGFYPEKGKKDGLTSRCRKCQREYGRAYYANCPDRHREIRKAYALRTRDVSLQRSKDFYYSIPGKAKSLLTMAKGRSRDRGWETDLTAEFIEKLLSTGICAVTKIPFILEPPNNTTKNAFAPSLDRIDSSKPYLRGNVRIVIWQYNLMKGELSDSQVAEICKEVVKHVG